MSFWFGFYLMPDYEYSIGVSELQVFVLPSSRLSRVKGDVLIVPVNSDAWLGGPVGKVVRDASGDIVQDQAKEVAPLSQGQAIAVQSNKGPAPIVILCNIYDDNKMANDATVTSGLDAAFNLADELKALTVVIPDFTAEFNYFEKRTDTLTAAKAVIEAAYRSQERSKAICVVVNSFDDLKAYKAAVASLPDTIEKKDVSLV